jgi:hypothetical protein
VKQDDDKALMEVLDQYGPVSVSIDSSHPKFVSYGKGDFNIASSNTMVIGS